MTTCRSINRLHDVRTKMEIGSLASASYTRMVCRKLKLVQMGSAVLSGVGEVDRSIVNLASGHPRWRGLGPLFVTIFAYGISYPAIGQTITQMPGQPGTLPPITVSPSDKQFARDKQSGRDGDRHRSAVAGRAQRESKPPKLQAAPANH